MYLGNLSVDGYATYGVFGTAADLFGASKSAWAASIKANLSQYAESIVSASNDGLNLTAVEKILAVQHDLIFHENVTIAEVIVSYSEGYFLGAFWPLLPFSRGSVHLGAKDDRPVIDPRYFLADFDMAVNIALGEQVQRFWHTEPIGEYIYANVTAEPSTDEAWADFIAESCRLKFHSCRACESRGLCCV